MPAYIPPWLNPADPTAQWARGFPMGLELAQMRQRGQQTAQDQQIRREEGARRAQEFAMEQELQRTRQKAMTDEARQRAELEEKYFTAQAKAAADKSAAILEYQQDIASGMDPTKAILRHGPAMGQSGAETQALRSQYMAEVARMREQHQADLMKQREEMQQKLFAQQKELADTRNQAAAARQQNALAARAGGTAEDREQVRSDRKILAEFEKEWGGPLGSKMAQKDPKAYGAALREAQDAAADILEMRPDDPQARRYAAGTPAAATPQQPGGLNYVRGPDGKLVLAPGGTATAPAAAPQPSAAAPTAPAGTLTPPASDWPAQEEAMPTIPAALAAAPPIGGNPPRQHGALMNWLLGTGEKPTAEQAAPGVFMHGLGQVGQALMPQTPPGESQWSRDFSAQAAARHAQNMAEPSMSLSDILKILSPSTSETEEDPWRKSLDEAIRKRQEAAAANEED